MGDFLSPAAVSFLSVVLTGIVVMVISMVLDRSWSRALSLRGLYYAISAPGVVVHECSHIAGCLITGAKIKRVVFFSKEGGSVTYQSPEVPLLGNVIIGTAPLFGIPLVLAALTWLFGTYLGCSLLSSVPALTSLDSAGALLSSAVSILYQNLVVQFNGWFLLYLYLTVSLVLSLSPSTQDIKNALVGLIILILAGLLVIWSAIPLLTDLLGSLMTLFATGLALGFVFELIAIIVTVPVVAVVSALRSC
jgi:hypothetical protein